MNTWGDHDITHVGMAPEFHVHFSTVLRRADVGPGV
jgi:hypothetical protein